MGMGQVFRARLNSQLSDLLSIELAHFIHLNHPKSVPNPKASLSSLVTKQICKFIGIILDACQMTMAAKRILIAVGLNLKSYIS